MGRIGAQRGRQADAASLVPVHLVGSLFLSPSPGWTRFSSPYFHLLCDSFLLNVRTWRESLVGQLCRIRGVCQLLPPSSTSCSATTSASYSLQCIVVPVGIVPTCPSTLSTPYLFIPRAPRRVLQFGKPKIGLVRWHIAGDVSLSLFSITVTTSLKGFVQGARFCGHSRNRHFLQL